MTARNENGRKQKMNKPTRVELIDRDELLEALYRDDVSTREKIAAIVERQPTVAVVRYVCEIEMIVTG